MTIVVGLTALVTLTPVTDSVSVEPLVTGVPPLGGLAVTVPVSLTEPLLRSACVTVYVAVHVAVAPGSNEKLPLVTGRRWSPRRRGPRGSSRATAPPGRR